MARKTLKPEEQRAYENLPIPFCVCQLRGDEIRLLAFSDGLCSAFQVLREDLSAHFDTLLQRYVHPDDLAKLRPDIANAAMNAVGEFAAVYRVRVKSRDYRWISGKGSVTRQEDESYLLYVTLSDVHDETELSRVARSDKLRQDVLLADILETTKTAIFWKDADRRFLGANRAFLDYYGFADESEILGKNDEEMNWHTEPDRFRTDELRVLQEGVSTYHVRGKCMARGENRDISASKSPLIVDGQIVGLVGSFEDVTKETRQQAEIRRLNAQLEEQISDRDLLMSISEVCIVKIDLADFTFLEYNDAMCRMIGCTREEYESFYHHDMAKFFTGEFRGELENLKKAVSDALAEGRSRFALNIRIPTIRGETWVGGAASFTDYDPKTKQPHSLYAVYRDITDIIEARQKQEQAEIEIRNAAEVKTQSERMRRMIDGVPSGLGALRLTDGVPENVMQINRYFYERIDIAVSEGGVTDLRAFLNCVHPDDRKAFKADFFAFLKSKSLTTKQYRFRFRTGGYVWYRVRGTVATEDENTEIAYFIYTYIDDIKKAEAELRESRRFYREVVQAAKLSTWDYDIGSHTLTLSGDDHTEDMRNIIGLDKVIKDVPASIVNDISPEDQPAFLQMYRDVEAGKNASCEAWYKPVNGREPRCERITYITVPGQDGRADRAIGFSQNITAERKVEERYQRELGYLRQTDENNLVAKGHYNLTKNVVLEYTTKNDSFYKVQPGISYDEMLKTFIAMSYLDEDRREIADKLNRSKLIIRYQHGQMQTSLVYRRARSGALPLWISMNIHTYMSPETCDLECFTYAYDVSGKMETDEIIGLIAEEEFDFIGLIYAETDELEFVKKSPDITFAKVRERMCYSASCDYIRNSFIDYQERDQYEAAVSVDNIIAGLLAGSGRHVATYRCVDHGRIFYKQFDYVWMDRLAKIILVVRSDVTATSERNQQQLARIEAAKLEADRANEAKSTFLSSMSHDLRTPLNGVIGFTGLALKETDPEKKQAYLQKIDSSGKLLLDLVNDTLELSRIESGKAVLEPEAVLPGELIPAVVTALRPSAQLKGIILTETYPPDKTLPVWCDKLKVQKIVLNLLSNAIKYTPEGGSVAVSLSMDAQQDFGWSLCVEDNGIGMSEEFMERMFEPFAQEKRSESLKTPGTGLGLAIVKRYVDLMGGRINVVSRLHKGTRWVVSLPICEVPAGKAQMPEPETALRSFAGKRVLLCEDNYMNTEIAKMLLKEQGVQVDAAENGALGAEQFAASAVGYYDAVLMDLRMPVMDGNTAARKIRAMSRADAKSVPIIAMTADAFEESVRESQAAGMNGYVTKPVEPEKLFRTLAELI